jgi:hypothetical protein
VSAGLGPRFKDERFLTLGQEVRCRGEANGACADHRDREPGIKIKRNWHVVSLSALGS